MKSEKKTHHKKCFGNILWAEHLRIFGRRAFVHVPEDRRKKLEKRAIKCCFVSYLGGMERWQFWVPVKYTFINSSHVCWLEDNIQGGEAVILKLIYITECKILEFQQNFNNLLKICLKIIWVYFNRKVFYLGLNSI